MGPGAFSVGVDGAMFRDIDDRANCKYIPVGIYVVAEDGVSGVQNSHGVHFFERIILPSCTMVKSNRSTSPRYRRVLHPNDSSMSLVTSTESIVLGQRMVA